MAVKRISQFPSGVPTDNDYILFEQDGNGKSAKFGDFSLTYEEIMANNIDLSSKVASAEALKNLNKVVMDYIEPTFINGIATFDISSILASNNMKKFNFCIAQFVSIYVNGNIIRACDKESDTVIRLTANNSDINGALGVTIIFY